MSWRCRQMYRLLNAKKSNKLHDWQPDNDVSSTEMQMLLFCLVLCMNFVTTFDCIDHNLACISLWNRWSSFSLGWILIIHHKVTPLFPKCNKSTGVRLCAADRANRHLCEWCFDSCMTFSITALRIPRLHEVSWITIFDRFAWFREEANQHQSHR